MTMQPCFKCGNLIIVKSGQLLSWGKKMKDEDKVFCPKCKLDIRESILKK